MTPTSPYSSPRSSPPSSPDSMSSVLSRSMRIDPLGGSKDRPRRRQQRLVFILTIITTLSIIYLAVNIIQYTSWVAFSSTPNPWAFLSPSDEAEPAGLFFNASDDSLYDGGCMPFETRLYNKPEPLSKGKYKFPYMRPPPACRKFNLSSLEALIEKMQTTIRDPDLFRLFENTFPNTLDTMVKWHGYANYTDPDYPADNSGDRDVVTDEELTYIITGDIDAMWLRDSAAQMQSYRSLLAEETNNHRTNEMRRNMTGAMGDTVTLAQLWRGLINIQARYISTSPYCHSFQPPRESGIPPTTNNAFELNHPFPAYDRDLVFDCKWELDSLASFLQVSATYYEETGDALFFARHHWVDAVEAAVDAAAAMREGMYDDEGHVLDSAYSFTGWTDRGTETLTNLGLGNPSQANGMVRSSFRPSDDATIFQFLVPANMMWAASLERASNVMEKLADRAWNPRVFQATKAANLTRIMREFASGVRMGIAKDAVVHHRVFGDIFAYEVDGYGSINLMDDANIPSLLSIPLLGFFDRNLEPALPYGNWGPNKDDTADRGAHEMADTSLQHEHDYAHVYENTRRFILSKANPYFAWGEPGGLAAVGGPHMGPGKAWPMAAIVTALTTYYYDAGSSSRARIIGDTTGSDEQESDRGPWLTQPLQAHQPSYSGQDKLVADQLNMLLNSTWGSGVMHESVDTWAPQIWTRPWFGWANGLFGELILAIARDDEQRPDSARLLSQSWQ